MGPITIDNMLELAKKHGLLIFVVLWLNNRLETVESKLYDCYEDKAVMKSSPMSDRKIYQPEKMYAILPSRSKSVEECLS